MTTSSNPAQGHDLAAVAAYFNGWHIYQQVIQHNYMKHRQVAQCLRFYLKSQALGQGSFLDLGCGDGSFAQSLFQTFSPSTYTGVDLSVTALGLARENFSQATYPVTFYEQELLAFLREHSQQFNVLLSAFSVHHLSLADKQAYFQQGRSHLQPGGVLVFVDVFRQEGESREAYLQRYGAMMRRDWTQLTPAVQAVLMEHITASDFPESESCIRDLAQQAGFSQVECLYTGGQDTEKILVISG